MLQTYKPASQKGTAIPWVKMGSRVTLGDQGQQNYKGRGSIVVFRVFQGTSRWNEVWVSQVPAQRPQAKFEGAARAETAAPPPALFFESQDLDPAFWTCWIFHITENVPLGSALTECRCLSWGTKIVSTTPPHIVSFALAHCHCLRCVALGESCHPFLGFVNWSLSSSFALVLCYTKSVS